MFTLAIIGLMVMPRRISDAFEEIGSIYNIKLLTVLCQK